MKTFFILLGFIITNDLSKEGSLLRVEWLWHDCWSLQRQSVPRGTTRRVERVGAAHFVALMSLHPI